MKSLVRPLLGSAALFGGAAVAQQDSALSFDGVNDRVMVPHDNSFPTEIFSLSAWIKLVPPGHRSAIIARGEDDVSFNLSWQLYVASGGTLEIMLEDQNEQNYCYPVTCMGQPQQSCVAGDLFVADDLWHHVAATRDAVGSLILYVDGQPQATCTQTGTPSSNNNQFLTIGCTHGMIGPPPPGEGEPPTWFFPGLIDEPAMWNVLLTGPEILDVFSTGVDPSAAGLVGYWDFNEGSGQLVVDGSPAGNDGFLGADDNKGGDGADPQWVTIDSDCPQDVDGSGQVGIADLLAVLSAWGPCADCPEDINDDGTVGISDLLAVLSAWGPCP